MIVEGHVEGEISIKRMYLPGVTLKDTCPQCGYGVVHDMTSEYVTCYPVIGKPFNYTWCCGECENEWEVEVQLDIKLTVVTPFEPQGH